MGQSCFLLRFSVLVLAGISSGVNATSGPGCLRVVNVAGWDTLNMRSGPSARNRIVDRLSPQGPWHHKAQWKVHTTFKKNGVAAGAQCHIFRVNGTSSGWVQGALCARQ